MAPPSPLLRPSPSRSTLLLGALLLLGLSAQVALSYHTTSDLEHPLYAKSEEDVRRELFHVHSWGYESPPAEDFAPYVEYIPPKTTGTVKHERELMYAAMHHVEKMHGHGHGVGSHGRGRNLQATNAAYYWYTQMAPSPLSSAFNYTLPPAAAPSAFDNCHPINNTLTNPFPDYNQTQQAQKDREMEELIWASLQQPSYPVDSPPDVLNASIVNALQEFGRSPQYNSKFGIAMKNVVAGRWYTWVSKSVWYWGADDWSTALWTCRYYQPGPKGYDCTYDRTCPGCDRCRGEHCFFNWNRYTYCSDPQCRKNWPITMRFKFCVQNPVECGMSIKVGTIDDIGWPGYDTL